MIWRLIEILFCAMTELSVNDLKLEKEELLRKPKQQCDWFLENTLRQDSSQMKLIKNNDLIHHPGRYQWLFFLAKSTFLFLSLGIYWVYTFGLICQSGVHWKAALQEAKSCAAKKFFFCD